MSVQDETPSALAEPTVPVRRGFIVAITLANLGIMIAFFTPIQNLLPRLAESVSPDSKEQALAWITGVGAFVSIIANPAAGALSDLTTSRLGRRKPWVLYGALLGGLAILALALQSTVLGLAVVWGVCQATINGAYAVVTATIPDQVPVAQRGRVSGWVGIAQVIGVVLGVALVSFAFTGLTAGIAVTAVLYILLVLPFVFRLHDPRLHPGEKPRLGLGEFVAQFWVSPREHPDFAWAWITRFLVSLGNALATLYLLYFLKDSVKVENPDQAQTYVILAYAIGSIITAVYSGKLSDRSGRRKIYVVVSSLVMAGASFILAFFPTFTATMVAALILGLGYGVYLAVDQALITQVLPNAQDRGRDLGVINIANAAPQVIAPVIAAPIVIGATGYVGLYVLTGLVTILSAILVRNIKSVP
jgi:MFS family permease